MNQDNIINEIKDTIEERLLVDVSQLDGNDNLKNTLGIDPEIDLLRLVSGIEQKYDISNEAKELLVQATTVNQLASIILEEAELG